jgi:hypothetical protein
MIVLTDITNHPFFDVFDFAHPLPPAVGDYRFGLEKISMIRGRDGCRSGALQELGRLST